VACNLADAKNSSANKNYPGPYPCRFTIVVCAYLLISGQIVLRSLEASQCT